jgi:hypothetical protein
MERWWTPPRHKGDGINRRHALSQLVRSGSPFSLIRASGDNKMPPLGAIKAAATHSDVNRLIVLSLIEVSTPFLLVQAGRRGGCATYE